MNYILFGLIIVSFLVDQAFNENVISHLASALTYIHKQNIIHRDIKVDVVLLVFTLIFKVSSKLSAFTTACNSKQLNRMR